MQIATTGDRWRGVVRAAQFTAQALGGAAVAIVRRPAAVLDQFVIVALGSFPLVVAAGASVGLVTWMQLRRLLVSYGIEAQLPSVLAVAVLVETGPILASLLVAGRLGAGLAAELASMRLAEELDARTAFGTSIIATLVAPRVLACTIAVPLLTILIDASAIGGGLLAEVLAGTLTAQVYCQKAAEFIRLSDVIPATLKTAVFGAIVGLVGCACGLGADRSSEAVGRAATRGVVRSMLAVFLANVVLVPVLQTVATVAGWRN